MGKVTGPLGPRRALASALRQLREEEGKLLNDVAKDLMISTSKLSRLENAQGRPMRRDVKDLVQYYGVAETPLGRRMLRWAEVAQRPGWWTDYEEVIGDLDAHLAYEVDATVARVYTIPFLPVLLQTVDYARAIFRDMEARSEVQIQQLLEVRLQRQAALRHREGTQKPLELIAVTHESGLRQVVGSPAVMRDQMNMLIDRSAAPNVTLRVLPFTARPTFSMTCMYAYFEYMDVGESDIVHIETPAGFRSVESAEQVEEYRAAHDGLMRASLSEEDSLALIRSVREEMARNT
ncbi:MAG TPA: Scr1 family TA system antitoxin-like transcriptional regulator [Streptosporangiaceae bacterium]|nr:Scr1 family TA system antitoxin-like transcriptional regulator [Streptosporangiaceae bacterium]